MQTARDLSDTRALLWRTGRWIIGLFWLIQYAALTAVAFIEGGDLAVRLLIPRALIVVSGVVLTTAIVEVAARTGALSFRRRLALTVATALAMCAALMAIDYVVYYVARMAGWVPFSASEFVYIAFGWCWFFLGVAGAVVGLCYSIEVSDRERRLAAMEAVAKDARLAALRYQLNPHFLFNTLNSIAALIADGDNRAAESMVENLADFLRATLELDPVRDIALSAEIHLQSLYLSIEEVRFSERLRVVYDVKPDAAGVQVPALITQPIVENVIRHSVARTTAPVTVRISASLEDGMLGLVVENDGAVSPTAPGSGMGVGLGNVRERLRSRFGDRHSLVVERLPAGFRVAIGVPAGAAA